jgi:PAS domain S-box-containing protein
MSSRSQLLQSPTGRYAIAFACALVGAILHWLVEPVLGPRIPFVLFLPGLLLAAASLGRGPALLALIIVFSNGIALFRGEPYMAAVPVPNIVPTLAYLAVGLTLILYGARLRWVTRQKLDIEKRLQLVQSSTGVGFFEVDLDEHTVVGTPTFWQLLGSEPHEAPVAMHEWTRRLHSEDVDRDREILAQKSAEGANEYEVEDRVLLSGGKIRPIITRFTLDRDEQGRVTRLRGAIGDISERKQAQTLLSNTQRELLQQVEDLRRLHELSVRLVQLDEFEAQVELVLRTLTEFHGAQKGLVSFYNSKSNRLQVRASIGFDAAALEWLTNVEGGTGACGRACIEKERVVVDNVDEDPSFTALREFARLAGFKAVHSTPMLMQSGEIIGALSVHFAEARLPTEREMRLADICARKIVVSVERRNAVAAARESDRRLNVALESAAVPFSILLPIRDASGTVVDFQWTYLNAAATTTLGQSLADLVGKRVTEVLPTLWEQPETLQNYIAVVERNEVREFDLHYRRDDGVESWLHVVASPMEGAVAAWHADISERRNQEEALREADRRKDEFLATLAHELRNPLAPIRQAAAIAKMPQATDAQKRWGQAVIERQVQHMALLLDDLLDVSRITRGRLELRKEQTDLGSIVEAAVETARPLIDAKRHSLSVDSPAEPLEFSADPLRVAQVISNLLTNAAKYTNPGGAIQLSVKREQDTVVIRVIDNGIGLSAQELPEIFQMFAQVKSAHDRSEGGLGIGLALAKGLVELHGGSIEAHSKGVNRGSEFTARFPLQPGAASHAKSFQVPAAVYTTARRILVADDNRDSANSLALLLSMDGHEVKLAHDGDEAVAAFDDFQPDVVLLDIGMPKRTGYEVAQHIRRAQNGNAVTLVAITGWGQESDKHRAMAAGFNHHFTKPLDPAQLTALIGARH